MNLFDLRECYSNPRHPDYNHKLIIVEGVYKWLLVFLHLVFNTNTHLMNSSLAYMASLILVTLLALAVQWICAGLCRGSLKTCLAHHRVVIYSSFFGAFVSVVRRCWLIALIGILPVIPSMIVLQVNISYLNFIIIKYHLFFLQVFSYLSWILVISAVHCWSPTSSRQPSRVDWTCTNKFKKTSSRLNLPIDRTFLLLIVFFFWFYLNVFTMIS